MPINKSSECHVLYEIRGRNPNVDTPHHFTVHERLLYHNTNLAGLSQHFAILHCMHLLSKHVNLAYACMQLSSDKQKAAASCNVAHTHKYICSCCTQPWRDPCLDTEMPSCTCYGLYCRCIGHRACVRWDSLCIRACYSSMHSAMYILSLQCGVAGHQDSGHCK